MVLCSSRSVGGGSVRDLPGVAGVSRGAASTKDARADGVHEPGLGLAAVKGTEGVRGPAVRRSRRGEGLRRRRRFLDVRIRTCYVAPAPQAGRWQAVTSQPLATTDLAGVGIAIVLYRVHTSSLLKRVCRRQPCPNWNGTSPRPLCSEHTAKLRREGQALGHKQEAGASGADVRSTAETSFALRICAISFLPVPTFTPRHCAIASRRMMPAPETEAPRSLETEVPRDKPAEYEHEAPQWQLTTPVIQLASASSWQLLHTSSPLQRYKPNVPIPSHPIHPIPPSTPTRRKPSSPAPSRHPP